MLTKIEKTFCHIESVIISAFLLIGILMVFAAVVARYIFRSPISWIDEVYPIIFAVGISLGYSVDFKEDELINVDVLYNAIKSRRIREILDLIYASSGIVYGGLMTWLSMATVDMQVKMHKVTLLLHFPLSIVYSCLVIAGVLLTVRGVVKLICTIQRQNVKRGKE